MVVYEIYWRDPIKGYQFLGKLPERRNNPARITHASIINWGKKFFGRNLDINGIFILQLEIDEDTRETPRQNPFFITQSGNLTGDYY
jgi:hypothetical protein